MEKEPQLKLKKVITERFGEESCKEEFYIYDMRLACAVLDIKIDDFLTVLEVEEEKIIPEEELDLKKRIDDASDNAFSQKIELKNERMKNENGNGTTT